MDESLSQLNRLITRIARELVDNPEAVRVRGQEGASTMVLELHVAKEDVGKIIGRHGRTANALRILVGAVGAKVRKRTVLEIVDGQYAATQQVPN